MNGDGERERDYKSADSILIHNQLASSWDWMKCPFYFHHRTLLVTIAAESMAAVAAAVFVHILASKLMEIVHVFSLLKHPNCQIGNEHFRR